MIAHTLALCASLLASPAEGRTCSCVAAVSDADAVARSEVVFVGRALRSRTVVARQGWRMRVSTFAVTRWRKGGRQDQVEVQTGMTGADCGIVFRRGRTYTVYGRHTAEGRVSTGLCDVPLESRMPTGPRGSR